MSDRKDFPVRAGTWLSARIHDGKVQVLPLRDALKVECTWCEGVKCSEDVLEEESQVIDSVPCDVSSIRSDKVERLAAREAERPQRSSVDVCCRMTTEMLLVECKYRAYPETGLVKNLDAFNSEIVQKFENSSSSLGEFLGLPFSDDRVVLFNHESVDKVLSMFNRLRKENDDVHHLASYVIVDTSEFLNRYFPAV